MKRLFSAIFLFLVLCCAQSGTFAQSLAKIDGDLSSLIITMKQDNKTGAIDGAPVYSVTIKGDGSVVYDGTANAALIGSKSYTIPVDQVRNLVKEFETANFFELNSEYTSRDNGDGTFTTGDHAAPITTSISVGEKYKKVYDFMFAPEKLKTLERKIYEISLIEQFIKPVSKVRPN